jgi:hypothetical protein
MLPAIEIRRSPDQFVPLQRHTEQVEAQVPIDGNSR